jgi:hypothetical protein
MNGLFCSTNREEYGLNRFGIAGQTRFIAAGALT